MAPRGFVETPLSFRRQHNDPREARFKHHLDYNSLCALLYARLALPLFESTILGVSSRGNAHDEMRPPLLEERGQGVW